MRTRGHRALALALRARSIDVITAHEAGLTGQDDDLVLAFAVNHRRTVYTFNAGDFSRLHSAYLRQGRDHSGIVIIPRQRYTVGEQLRRLFQLINTTSAEHMRNRLEFLKLRKNTASVRDTMRRWTRILGSELLRRPTRQLVKPSKN